MMRFPTGLKLAAGLADRRPIEAGTFNCTYKPTCDIIKLTLPPAVPQPSGRRQVRIKDRTCVRHRI